MNNRTQHVDEICEIIGILGQNDYRVGQSILNVVRHDLQENGGDLAAKLYSIENDELLMLLKKFAAQYMPH